VATRVDAPAVSVIVPTCNRPDQLRACLEALTALDPPVGGFETIVVDDGGHAELTPAIAAVRDRLAVELLRVPHGGPAAARNAGIRRARGTVLAFTDDDCRPRPDWLRVLSARLESKPTALVGGPTTNPVRASTCSEASQLIIDLVYKHYNAAPDNARFLASNNFAARADVLKAAGGFNEEFRTSEDRELCDRWRVAGRPLVFAPDAVVEHERPLSPVRFGAQHFAYGRGAYRYHRTRARRNSGRIRDEMDFYVSLPRLLRSAASGIERRRLPAFAGLLMLWQAANAAGFGWEAVLARRRG
jgi:GT2 family glycosyltransferase